MKWTNLKKRVYIATHTGTFIGATLPNRSKQSIFFCSSRDHSEICSQVYVALTQKIHFIKLITHEVKDVMWAGPKV